MRNGSASAGSARSSSRAAATSSAPTTAARNATTTPPAAGKVKADAATTRTPRTAASTTEAVARTVVSSARDGDSSRAGRRPDYTSPMPDGTLRIIPLGGLGEVGKNMTVFESEGEIVVVDAGLAFPREDHLGALPYLLREVRVPEVWATRLTLGLIQSKLDEHGLLGTAELKEAEPGERTRIGPFDVEFVRMAHSIPDTVATMLESPAGRVLVSADWKLDHTPVDGLKTDVGALAELGNRGIDLLVADSTNAERPGMTGSERLVGEAFRQIIPQRRGRILVASFASNLHRMQQAIDVAVECRRKVAVVGRSMRKNINIARSLGYIDVPDEALIRPNELDDYERRDVLILCTGSQGEPLSALVRIAYNDHPAIKVEAGDTVIISAKPVPGNELKVHDAINQLARSGAEVLHQ